MVKFKTGYKYQLDETYTIQTDIIGYRYESPFISLNILGLLTIWMGYAWDGASGPTKDDKTNTEPSLVHDGLYQLMRLGVIPNSCRRYIDNLFISLCKDKGMPAWRRWYYRKGVYTFSKPYALPKNKRRVITYE